MTTNLSPYNLNPLRLEVQVFQESEEDHEAYQCKRCHRMYHVDDANELNNFECGCGGSLVGIPIERYEDHLENLNLGEL